MKTRLVEKMEKWSRKVGTLTKVARGLAVVVLVLIVLYILSVFGIQLLPGIAWKTLLFVVGIPFIVLALLNDLLLTVTKHGKLIFNQNKLIYVFLSNEKVVTDILALICIATTLLPFQIINTLCLIVLILFPRKIAEHFEAKLKK